MFKSANAFCKIVATDEFRVFTRDKKDLTKALLSEMPQFCSVSAREFRAIVSSSWSEFEVIRCSNRWTRSDFLRAKLSRVSTNDINITSCANKRSQTRIDRVKRTYSQRTVRVIVQGEMRLPPRKTTAASGTSGRRRRKCNCRSLEREI